MEGGGTQFEAYKVEAVALVFLCSSFPDLRLASIDVLKSVQSVANGLAHFTAAHDLLPEHFTLEYDHMGVNHQEFDSFSITPVSTTGVASSSKALKKSGSEKKMYPMQ